MFFLRHTVQYALFQIWVEISSLWSLDRHSDKSCTRKFSGGSLRPVVQFWLWDPCLVASGALLKVTNRVLSLISGFGIFLLWHLEHCLKSQPASWTFIFWYGDLSFIASKTGLEVAIRFVDFVFPFNGSLTASWTSYEIACRFVSLDLRLRDLWLEASLTFREVVTRSVGLVSRLWDIWRVASPTCLEVRQPLLQRSCRRADNFFR